MQIDGVRPVLDFSTGADQATVQAALPGIGYWMKNVEYTWIERTDPLGNLKRFNSAPTMKLPSVFLQFDDGTGPDRNKQANDQTKPNTLIAARAGGLFYDMRDLIPSAAKRVQFGTWDDVKEGTDAEKFASLLSGRIG
jgi:hypothetical protein